MIKRTRGHQPQDRYFYDRGMCSSKNGWAQIDTKNDAWYCGQWANPFKLSIFSYVEGDTILTQCDTVEEFKAELEQIKKCHGKEFMGIDALCNDKNIKQWHDIGLGDMLH